MKNLKEFSKEIVAIILILVVSLVVFLLFFISFSWIQGNLFIPEEFTIWGVRAPYDKIVSVIECIIFFGLISAYFKMKKRKTGKEALMYASRIEFSKSIKIIGAIVMLYLYFINIMCIKDEMITLRSTFSPLGKEYSLQDVKKVETGFNSNKKFLGSSKGTFYYIIILNDGKKIDINNFSSEGKKYEEDTYSAIEEIDKRIMESNSELVKTSSLDYSEYAVLDQQYMDRFERIINN
ncbi:hypothetical protein [Clostridium vincentii]|uniref:Uncharacterized protein n=1 Tax=Clostridium vincentii TaxID=52704 RepID=A0A2T0BEI3_9CLOT|nr:hypothetical protein [Clostridium vincentii]PRR82253.1 hypothetical protein CLVI_19130 [Clostridium vincentii]